MGPMGRLRHAVRVPQALLWDCDGVLCDTECDGHRVAFNEAFKQKGALVCCMHARKQGILSQPVQGALMRGTGWAIGATVVYCRAAA